MLIHITQDRGPQHPMVVTVRLSTLSIIVAFLTSALMIRPITGPNEERSLRANQFFKETIMDRIWPPAEERKQRTDPEASPEV
jgi:hypothetical protein